MIPALSINLVFIQNFDVLSIIRFCMNFNFVRHCIRFITLDCGVFRSPLNVPEALVTPFLVCVTQGAHVFVASSPWDRELFEGRDSTSLSGCNRGLIELPCQPLLSADSLAQNNVKSFWWRVQIFLQGRERSIMSSESHLDICCFSSPQFFSPISRFSLSLGFFSFPHSCVPLHVYTHWAKQTPNHCCSLRFPLEWWWWWEYWADGLR